MPNNHTVKSIAVRLFPAAAFMGVIFILSARSSMPHPPGVSPEPIAMAGHFVAYAVLAALLYGGVPATTLSPGQRLVIAFVGAVTFGIAAEIYQMFLPEREASLLDVALDALGAACGLFGVRRIERRRWRPESLPAD